MDIKTIFGIVASILTFAGFVPYIYDIFKLKTRPHAFSWFIWSLSTFIIYLLQVQGGAGAGAWLTLTLVGILVLVFVLSLKYGTKDIHKIDIVFLLLSLSAIPLWIVLDQPLLSMLLLTAIDLLGFLPTIRKSWNDPYSETTLYYWSAVIRYVFGIAALIEYNTLTLMFPIAWLIGNGAFALMLMTRRKLRANITPMSTFKVLVEGYLRITGTGIDHACSSVVYIDTGDTKIIVDPGIDREALLTALAENAIAVEDIDYIVVTHGHADHYLLAGIFPNAGFIESGYLYKWDASFQDAVGVVPGTDVRIVASPGHTDSHSSVVFDTEEHGTVVVAGDLFFWPDGEGPEKTTHEVLMDLHDPYAMDYDALAASRKTLLEDADYIIPGHGKAFAVEK